MSKTFNSAVSEGRISIEEAPGGLFTVGIRRDGVVTDLVDLAPSDAPALALAILEAAGVESPYYNLKDAVDNLRQHVEREARHAAAAEAQAELEAEALELRNAYFGDVGSEREWSDLTIGAQSTWLAVARRAREMRAEK